MTRPSRGVSDIQEKARGNKMRKLKNKESVKVSVKKKAPSVAGAGPMGMPAGRPGSFGGMGSLGAGPAPMGMKKGGACKGYAKGGSIDGIASKGKTKGKIC
jgi:hypothetical protein